MHCDFKTSYSLKKSLLKASTWSINMFFLPMFIVQVFKAAFFYRSQCFFYDLVATSTLVKWFYNVQFPYSNSIHTYKSYVLPLPKGKNQVKLIPNRNFQSKNEQNNQLFFRLNSFFLHLEMRFNDNHY